MPETNELRKKMSHIQCVLSSLSVISSGDRPVALGLSFHELNRTVVGQIFVSIWRRTAGSDRLTVFGRAQSVRTASLVRFEIGLKACIAHRCVQVVRSKKATSFSSN
jgi:urease beta subunit